MKQANDAPQFSRDDIETIIRISRAHAERVLKLKQAILAGDTEAEHRLAREVCGLPPEPPDEEAVQ